MRKFCVTALISLVLAPAGVASSGSDGFSDGGNGDIVAHAGVSLGTGH
jgi:hypothetical protein